MKLVSINAKNTKALYSVAFNVVGCIDKQALDYIKSNIYRLHLQDDILLVTALSPNHPISREDVLEIEQEYKEAVLQIRREKIKESQDRMDLLLQIKGRCGLALDSDCQFLK